MYRVGRAVYHLLLQLHPAEFRERFADEMLLDYNAGLRTICGSAPHWDALTSLGRQWLDRFAETNDAETSAASLFVGQYVALPYDSMTAFDLMRGLLLSLTLFGAFGYAATPSYSTTIYLHPPRAVIRQSQSPETRARPVGQNIAVRDVSVVDVEHGTLSPHMTVLIRGDEIVSVSRARLARGSASRGNGRDRRPGEICCLCRASGTCTHAHRPCRCGYAAVHCLWRVGAAQHGRRRKWKVFSVEASASRMEPSWVRGCSSPGRSWTARMDPCIRRAMATGLRMRPRVALK